MFLAKTVFLGALLNLLQCSYGQNPIVQLPDGTIRGRTDVTDINKSYSVFEKIPYATPPVGDLRFQAPLPPKPWQGVLDTLDLDVICYQQMGRLNAMETEDCLYLNVYTPQLPSSNNNVSLPVLVWIYGGGFVGGSAVKDQNGPDYYIDEDIVVVDLNYRIGALGFLSTGDEVIPGNAGLKDQHLAIKWVHDNIALFGGDPNRITVFGKSAGSASVSYQLLHQKNEGLFRAAISSSGLSINVWTLEVNPRKIAFELGNLIDSNFNSTNSTELLNFLNTIDASTLDKIGNGIKTGPEFGPAIEVEHEGAFLTQKPYQLVKNGNFVRVPYLFGFNSEESLGFSQFATLYENDPTFTVPWSLGIGNDSLRLEVAQEIKNYYYETFQNNQTAAFKHITDNLFVRGAIKYAQLASKYIDAYLYRFAYSGQLGGGSLVIPGCDLVGHAADSNYVWRRRSNYDLSKYPQEDITTHERFIRLHSNFIKYLNPTPNKTDDVLGNFQWPKVNSTSGDTVYFDFDKDLTVQVNPRNDMYQFWTSLFSRFNESEFATF